MEVTILEAWIKDLIKLKYEETEWTKKIKIQEAIDNATKVLSNLGNLINTKRGKHETNY